MFVIRSVAIAAILITLVPAARAACPDVVTGHGRAANPANYDPPRHYDMAALARSRAIADWRILARRQCLGTTAMWARAAQKKVECEGYAGGTECTASAIPAR